MSLMISRGASLYVKGRVRCKHPTERQLQTDTVYLTEAEAIKLIGELRRVVGELVHARYMKRLKKEGRISG